MRGLVHAASLALGLGAAAPASAVTHEILEFSALDGWEQDDHEAALDVFLETCRDLRDPDWSTLCRTAADWNDAKLFFEMHFRPVLIEDGTPMLFTAYYEPELLGSRFRGGAYQYPIYATPEEAEEGTWLTRAEIEEGDVMTDRGLEIAYLMDPVDVYFLQVQGSGRVRLDDGTAIRVGYGGKNGHPYRSIGKELIRRGEMDEHSVNIDRIREWVDGNGNGEEGIALLHHNPSYVFFREVSHVPADRGPLGAMNRSITAMRSIAVDPNYTRLGAPVWIETDGAQDLHRLMIAHDTGAAIKGPQRADIFFGTGKAAGKAAGTVREGGRMVVLLPIQRAYATAEGI